MRIASIRLLEKVVQDRRWVAVLVVGWLDGAKRRHDVMSELGLGHYRFA